MWETRKLNDLCRVVRGGSPRPMGDPKYFDGDIPFIKIGDITSIDGDTIYDSEVHVNERGTKKSRLLKQGSLILSNSGTVCIPKFLGVDACIHDGFVSFLDLPNHISKNFLFHYFNYLRPYVIEEHKQGVTQVNLNTKIVGEFEIPVPPLPTQHRIVEKIEELFSDLDNGIENLNKAHKQLKTYRQAVLKDAFEGKLTKEWRERQEDLPTPNELLEQIKAERKANRERELAEWEDDVKQWEEKGKLGRKPSKPRKSKELDPVGEDALNDLPQIPENWEYTRIGNIGNVGTGATPLKKENSYYEKGTIPWVTSGALNNEYVREASDFVTKKALDETNLSLFPKHTLLVAMYGEGKTRGKCSELLIEATTNQAIAAIVQNKGESKTKDFLKYFLLKNYNDIRRMSSGGVQPNLNLGIIENTIVPLAPEQEQHEIVNKIEVRLSVVDQLEKTIKENLQKAEALRQSILKKAFNGELVSK